MSSHTLSTRQGTFTNEPAIQRKSSSAADGDDDEFTQILRLEQENAQLKAQLASLLSMEICPYFADMKDTLDPLAIKILSYWFGPNYRGGGDEVAPEQYHLWFGKSSETDLEIQVRFAEQLDRAASGLFDHWCAHPYGTLALVILMDQFPRNVYRNHARGFAYDWKACLMVWEGLDAGQDEALSPMERVWFYLVLTHTEDLQSQRLCVALGNTKLEGMEENFKNMWQLIFKKHLVVIEKFGRFAHRNKALKRIPTQMEEDFVNDPSFRFDLPVKLSIDQATGMAKFEFVSSAENGEKKKDEDLAEEDRSADKAVINNFIGAVNKVIAVNRISRASQELNLKEEVAKLKLAKEEKVDEKKETKAEEKVDEKKETKAEEDQMYPLQPTLPLRELRRRSMFSQLSQLKSVSHE
eukprot:CAMPEP_0183761012 /NCGR_PEP_ID=MMETSP0739-20130205/8144_1 /TAXON_ID=385413 /ORGANISM="Thalassiosira miniscula, Strain CCMP1093" /LENGTH=409 /DNA_ID=CAMNT_0025999077 /DNA_START=30 /DNA_END=1259 /DNA_ORIENTATION=+